MKKTFGILTGDNYLTTSHGGDYGEGFKASLTGKKGYV